MILEERTIIVDPGDIFKIIAQELDKNLYTQVLINQSILKELIENNSNYHVYFHSLTDRLDINEWFTLHEEHIHTPIISRLAIEYFGNSYYKLSRFSFRGFNFPLNFTKNGELIFSKLPEYNKRLIFN